MRWFIPLLIAVVLAVTLTAYAYSGFTVSPTFVVVNATNSLVLINSVTIPVNISLVNPPQAGSYVGSITCGGYSTNFVVNYPPGYATVYLTLKPLSTGFVVGELVCNVTLSGYPPAELIVYLGINASPAYLTVSPTAVDAMPNEGFRVSAYGNVSVTGIYYGGVYSSGGSGVFYAVCGGLTKGWVFAGGYAIPFTVMTPSGSVSGVSANYEYYSVGQPIYVSFTVYANAPLAIGVPFNYTVIYPGGSVSGYASIPPGYSYVTLSVRLPINTTQSFNYTVIVNNVYTSTAAVYITPSTTSSIINIFMEFINWVVKLWRSLFSIL